jgi:hypothetical protein
MKHSILGLLSILLPVSASAVSLNATPVVSLSWGNGDKQVALDQAPDYNRGPPSLTTNGATIYLLDADNQRIVGIDLNQDHAFSSIPLDAADPTDFCVDNQARFHVMYASEFRLASRDEGSWTSRPMGKTLAPLSLACGDGVLVGAFDGNFYRPGDSTVLSFPPLGTYQVSLSEQSPSRWRFSLSTPQQRKLLSINTLSVEHSKADIISVNLLGTDSRGNIYTLHEEASGDTVTRALRVYSADGSLLAQREPYISAYTYMLKEFAVVPDGGVLQMLSTENGIVIIHWSIGAKGDSEALRDFQKQLDAREPGIVLAEAPQATRGSSRGKSGAKSGSRGGKVSRRAVMALAKQYADYTYTVARKNLANGTRDDGKAIVTPVRRPGVYTGVPYKWGGEDTLEAFSQGLAMGRKAGDMCAIQARDNCPGEYYSGSSGAVGVDCSGFISVLWQTENRQTTATLPSISNGIHWHQLKPGDILNVRNEKIYHVMLFSGRDRAGNILVYEASGNRRYGKVVRTRHTQSKLIRQGYTPYRYRYIIDTPVDYPPRHVPQPPRTASVSSAAKTQNGVKVPISLHITGRTVIPERQSVLYYASVIYSDATTATVTNKVKWIENSAYAAFSGSTLHTEHIEGDENLLVQARYQEAGRAVKDTLRVRIKHQRTTPR